MKTMKKNKKGKGNKGKRVLKRICLAATSQQSSYSSLISDYVLESAIDLSLNSDYVESVHEEQYIQDQILEESGEDEDPFQSDGNQGRNPSPSSRDNNSPRQGYSVAGEEEINEESSQRMMKHNSPRESFKVFNQ
mmetsp:Transcript_3338/g.3947  ORF Transcript_3338/g.3947 Transcript_3338/m.3947 type:complete len:135 (+) Transcript_3338:225-629(+)